MGKYGRPPCVDLASNLLYDCPERQYTIEDTLWDPINKMNENIRAEKREEKRDENTKLMQTSVEVLVERIRFRITKNIRLKSLDLNFLVIYDNGNCTHTHTQVNGNSKYEK